MRTSANIQNSAQGLFMLMTNGIGATVGTLCAQGVVNHFVFNPMSRGEAANWSAAWYVFAGYAIVVAIAFMIFFNQPSNPNDKVA
jgi:phosphotransferase system  glucose/maltose/N-acetylglucosamine-specific IIC component